jgi:hypothetical protein
MPFVRRRVGNCGGGSDLDDGLKVFDPRKRVVEMMEKASPLAVSRRAPEAICVVLEMIPLH